MNRKTTFLLLFLAIGIISASIPAFAITRIQKSYSANLLPGFGYASQYITADVGPYPYLSTTNPSGATLCVGYQDAKGHASCYYVTAGNLGAIGPGGTYACVWINRNSFSVYFTGVCTWYID